MTLQAALSRDCEACGKTFQPFQTFQRVCAKAACAKRFVDRKKKDAERRERESVKLRRDALKTLGDWTKEAQVAFNAWVRARDLAAGHGCIDCGKPFEPSKPGGSVDAGHYLSVGSAVHLRFDERNVFAQRKNCNRPGGTTRAAFRAGVVARIGEDAVAALERDQSVRQYRPDDLKAIRDEYRARLKALQKAAA
jgi:hypothetical protein